MKKLLVAIALVLVGIVAIGVYWILRPSPTLTVWHTESSPETQRALMEMNAEFERQHHVKVVCEYISWGNLSSQLNLAMESQSVDSLPDVSHLEPYMAYSLYRDNRLEDISDIVETIEKDNGKIRDAVRTLQLFDNKYYGIAQHVGVSFILYRADLLAKHQQKVPETWNELFRVCEYLHSAKGEGEDFYPIALPASSPFFMECILSEYLNSRGARLFDDDGAPRLVDNEELKDVLGIFARMSKYVTRDCERTEYLGQFGKLYEQDAAFVMFAGGRAFTTFEQLDGLGDEPERYKVLMPPRFDKGSSGRFTSLDCEPFVIFKKSRKQTELAKEWLRTFYAKNNYLRFCHSVPIQLIPIFGTLDGDYRNNKAIKKWHTWYAQADVLIRDKQALPYFMQVGDRKDLDFLFDLYDSQILYGLVISCLRAGEVDDGEVLSAHEKMEKLIRRSSRVVRISEPVSLPKRSQ